MRSIDALPEPLARAIRQAQAPADLRALFTHLPVVVRVDAALPNDASALPTAARQLLKLASLGGRLELGEVTISDRLALRVLGDSARFDVDTALLAGPVHAVVRRALEEVLGAGPAARALGALALRSARLTGLQALTRHMLMTCDLARAQRVLLAGVTSGAGLAFNRAALFVRDDSKGDANVCYRGARAIGPADDHEAHRIWEAIEYEDKSLDEQLSDSAGTGVDTRFEALVREIVLVPVEGDELSEALGSPTPLLFQRERLRNGALPALGVARELVLAALRPRGEARALLFVDNAFTQAPIDGESLELLGFFLDQATLVWDNLSLLADNERLARFDSLTGLFNRRGFDERFAEEISRAARLHEPCALLVLDIDEFKAVNDARGHEEGDRVLRRTAELLRHGTREHDVAVRLGGDEMAVLLPETTKEAAQAVAVRVGGSAAREGISLSIGGAAWPDDCVDASRLLSVADGQLYLSKGSGRRQARFKDWESRFVSDRPPYKNS